MVTTRVKAFVDLFSTFVRNVIDRFHEYADRSLASDLSIAEQKKRAWLR